MNHTRFNPSLICELRFKELIEIHMPDSEETSETNCAEQSIKPYFLFTAAAQLFASPFHAISWVGNKVTGRAFKLVDKTKIGEFIRSRAYRIGGPSFVTGDLGFIGYALEHGNHLQLSGALATLPAHILLALLGDAKPLINDLADKLQSTSVVGKKVATTLKSTAIFLANNDKYLIPAAWGLLACNGFSLAAAAITDPQISKDLLHAVQKVPELLQGIAIFTGCLCMGVNDYIKRIHKNSSYSKEREALTNKLGNYAIGILTSCTLLTIATGLADHSPSLLAISSPAFLLGNYCQHRMRQKPAVQIP